MTSFHFIKRALYVVSPGVEQLTTKDISLQLIATFPYMYIISLKIVLNAIETVSVLLRLILTHTMDIQ